MKYGDEGQILEITIRDFRGGKVDFFRVNNNKDYKHILKILKQKYGFDAEEKEEYDPQWIEKDIEW